MKNTKRGPLDRFARKAQNDPVDRFVRKAKNAPMPFGAGVVMGAALGEPSRGRSPLEGGWGLGGGAPPQ